MVKALKLLCAVVMVAFFVGLGPRVLQAAGLDVTAPMAEGGCHDNTNCNAG